MPILLKIIWIETIRFIGMHNRSPCSIVENFKLGQCLFDSIIKVETIHNKYTLFPKITEPSFKIVNYHLWMKEWIIHSSLPLVVNYVSLFHRKWKLTYTENSFVCSCVHILRDLSSSDVLVTWARCRLFEYVVLDTHTYFRKFKLHSCSPDQWLQNVFIFCYL